MLRENIVSTASTEDWVILCGTTLVWVGTKESLEKAIKEIVALRAEFWKDVYVPGTNGEFNPELEKALRVADFLELGELMARDGLHREESCGGHFREEYQTPEGEALRNDEKFKYVGAWEYKGENQEPVINIEQLIYESIEVKQRNYKLKKSQESRFKSQVFSQLLILKKYYYGIEKFEFNAQNMASGER